MIRFEPKAQQDFAHEKTIADFLRIECEVVRRFKNRRTGRFRRNGRVYYIKTHEPAGWWSIIEELLHLRLPQIGARPEWRALRMLDELGIPAARIAAFGEQGIPSPWQRSFLVTEEIPADVSLEALFAGPMAPSPGCSFRRKLVRAIAAIARTLHTNGINHRDFYLCHFLLAAAPRFQSDSDETPTLYLLDLHRAQKRLRAPRRWIVKDLAGLLFSALDVELTPRELLLFVRCYAGMPAQKALSTRSRFWRIVEDKARSLYRKVHRRQPVEALAFR